LTVTILEMEKSANALNGNSIAACGRSIANWHKLCWKISGRIWRYKAQYNCRNQPSIHNAQNMERGGPCGGLGRRFSVKLNWKRLFHLLIIKKCSNLAHLSSNTLIQIDSTPSTKACKFLPDRHPKQSQGNNE
jgi:hypothetical protein